MGVVRVCTIGADRFFCEKLEQQLAETAGSAVKVIATLDRVPEQGQWAAEAIVFNPLHPDFQKTDAIDRLQRLFGQDIVLIAYLSNIENNTLLEDLEASGVTVVAEANDFAGMALYLTGLSHESAVFARTKVDSDSMKTPLHPEPLIATPLHPDPLLPTPLHPDPVNAGIEIDVEAPISQVGSEKQTVYIGIIHTDPSLASYLSTMLRTIPELGEYAQVQDTFYEIPTSVDYVIKVVIFDPEMDDFRNMADAVKRMRAVFGQDVMLIAHTDAWISATRLREQMLKAGIRVGLSRENLKGLVQIMQLLINSDMRTIYETFKAI